jgi:hypothetical protein
LCNKADKEAYDKSTFNHLSAHSLRQAEQQRKLNEGRMPLNDRIMAVKPGKSHHYWVHKVNDLEINHFQVTVDVQQEGNYILDNESSWQGEWESGEAVLDFGIVLGKVSLG